MRHRRRPLATQPLPETAAAPGARPRPARLGAFTLVEVLIVVVILGIIAGIVVPSLGYASTEARHTQTYSQLQQLRHHVQLYLSRTSGEYPEVTAGDGTWGQIVGQDHLPVPPVNTLVGGENARRIVLGTGPDTTMHRDYAWIYNPSNGMVWAVGLDADGNLLPVGPAPAPAAGSGAP